MSTLSTKRISVTLPNSLLKRLNAVVPPLERSALLSDLLEEYLDEVEAEIDQEERQEQRRQQRKQFLTRIRASGQKAADLFLP